MTLFRKNISFNPLIFVIAAFVLVRLLFVDIVPFWDAKSVTDCVYDALIPVFRPLRLNCHHPSMGYLGLFALGQMFDLYNDYILNLTNLILATLALIGFSQILNFFFFPQKLPPAKNYLSFIELAVMTALLAFHPLFFTHSISPALDFGVTVFFILSLSALIYQRVHLAVLFMSLLVFSKETGLLLYLTLIAAYIVIPVLPSLSHMATGFRKLVNRFIAFHKYYLPLGLFVTYYIYQARIAQQGVFWRSNYNLFLNFALRDPKSAGRTLTRMLQTFVLDFNWLLSIAIVGFVFISVVKIVSAKKLTLRLTRMSQRDIFRGALLLCFFVYGYFIFLLNTYTLVRYVVPLIPMLLLFGFFATKKLFTRPYLRLGIYTAVLFLFFLQTFRTVDPISKQVFGSIPFGSHQILRMTKYVDECCGTAGQDQLAYNTEHLVIDRLIGRFYRTVKVRPAVPLLVSGLDAAELFTQADTVSFSRTLKPDNLTVPTVYITGDLSYLSADRLGVPAFFVYLPWNDVLEEQLAKIAPYYEIGPAHEIDYYGYELYYFPLTPKSKNQKQSNSGH